MTSYNFLWFPMTFLIAQRRLITGHKQFLAEFWTVCEITPPIGELPRRPPSLSRFARSSPGAWVRPLPIQAASNHLDATACNETHSAFVSPKFTRVPQGGGLVQGWESVCWRMVGRPLLENKKVIWCVGFLVLFMFWFLGFAVPHFQSFEVSKIQHSFDVLLRDSDPILPNFISWFVENIDPVFKISKNF